MQGTLREKNHTEPGQIIKSSSLVIKRVLAGLKINSTISPRTGSMPDLRTGSTTSLVIGFIPILRTGSVTNLVIGFTIILRTGSVISLVIDFIPSLRTGSTTSLVIDLIPGLRTDSVLGLVIGFTINPTTSPITNQLRSFRTCHKTNMIPCCRLSMIRVAKAIRSRPPVSKAYSSSRQNGTNACLQLTSSPGIKSTTRT